MSVALSPAKPYKGIGMEGAIARWYAGLTRKSMDRFIELAHRMAAELPPASSVLEVAPGPGYLSIELAKLGHYQITGLDISQTFVEIARKNVARANVNVEFQRGDVAHMPFANDSFDFLVCCAAFKNFTQPIVALREMWRVLKPSGTALIIDLRRDVPYGTLQQYVNGLQVGAMNKLITKLTFRFMLLKRAYTKAEFEQLVRQTKFAGSEIREDAIALEVRLEKAG
jgi:ubiquinone/menaquinone biosynthesis C-methylase UbiE